jgi:hypothetical protein
MRKLRNLLERIIDGEKVRGYSYLSLSDIHELVRVYNLKVNKEITTTINGNVIKVLDICKIKYKVNGIGWII